MVDLAEVKSVRIGEVKYVTLEDRIAAEAPEAPVEEVEAELVE